MFSRNKFKRIISCVIVLAMMMMLVPVSVAAVDTVNYAYIGISGKFTSGTADAALASAQKYDAEFREDGNNNYMQFATTWDATNFYVNVEVGDTKVIDGDTVEICVGPAANAAAGTTPARTVTRSYNITTDAQEIDDDVYSVTAEISFESLGITDPYEGNVLALEVVNTDKDSEEGATATLRWNKSTDDSSTWGFMCLYINVKPIIMKPTTTAPAINGTIDDSEPWDLTSYANDKGTLKMAALYDDTNLYIAADMYSTENIVSASWCSLQAYFDFNNVRSDGISFIAVQTYYADDNNHWYKFDGGDGSYTSVAWGDVTFNSQATPVVDAEKTLKDPKLEISVKLSVLGDANARFLPKHGRAFGLQLDYGNTKWSNIMTDDGSSVAKSFGTIITSEIDLPAHTHSYELEKDNAEHHSWSCSDENCTATPITEDCFYASVACGELIACAACGYNVGQYQTCVDEKGDDVCDNCGDSMCGYDPNATEWSKDDTHHWKEHDDCPTQHDFNLHIPGTWKLEREATEDEPGLETTNCTACGAPMTRDVEYQPDAEEEEEEEEEEEGNGIAGILMMLLMKKYTITAEAGEGGTISSVGDTKVRFNTDIEYTITPNSGYSIEAVYVDGEDVGAVSSYTFDNVRKAHTIKVTFKKN